MKKSSVSILRVMVALVFVACIAIISCKKDKSEDPPVKTKKELLANKWKVADIQDASGNSLINLPVDQIKCLKDNIFTIVSDATYSIDEGAVVCDPTTAGSGTWTLSENDTQITFTPTTGDPLTITLIDVTETTLKVSYYLSEPVPGTYTVILQKQ
ncbi:MAG: lipocalin family protein [Agriterribacter sp.]